MTNTFALGSNVSTKLTYQGRLKCRKPMTISIQKHRVFGYKQCMPMGWDLLTVLCFVLFVWHQQLGNRDWKNYRKSILNFSLTHRFYGSKFHRFVRNPWTNAIIKDLTNSTWKKRKNGIFGYQLCRKHKCPIFQR